MRMHPKAASVTATLYHTHHVCLEDVQIALPADLTRHQQHRGESTLLKSTLHGSVMSPLFLATTDAPDHGIANARLCAHLQQGSQYFQDLWLAERCEAAEYEKTILSPGGMRNHQYP